MFYFYVIYWTILLILGIQIQWYSFSIYIDINDIGCLIVFVCQIYVNIVQTSINLNNHNLYIYFDEQLMLNGIQIQYQHFRHLY